MKIAVVCASGIGDALIVHSISHLLVQQGSNVTTYSDHLTSFGPWLQGFQFAKQPQLESIEDEFSGCDALFLQHDNSPKAIRIKKLPLPVYTFYGAHVPSKHGPLQEKFDYVCDRTKSMVENIALAAEKFFGAPWKDNGLKPPKELMQNRYGKRIAIHPTASSLEKTWPREKFLNLQSALKAEGYDPVFTVSPLERVLWNAPLFPTLGDLASFLYESRAFIGNDSGTGHLASSLGLPHLIIGGNGLQMPLWRTGWHPGTLVAPPRCLMRLKMLRKHWKSFVSIKKVINNFTGNVLRN